MSPKFAFLPDPSGDIAKAQPVLIKDPPRAEDRGHEYEEDLPEALDDPDPPKKGMFRKKPVMRVRELKTHEGMSLKDKFRWKFKSDRCFLVTMRFSNGTMKTWSIVSKKEFFKYRKKYYHLYYENAWYDLTHRVYHLDFFDDYVEPIDRRIYLKEDPDAEKGHERALWAVTPANVKPIIKYEYVKALAEANVINKFLKMILLICVVLFLLAGFNAYKSNQIVGVLKLMAQALAKIPVG